MAVQNSIFRIMKGHTQCADWLTIEYGLTTSAVFGRIWRYAQGNRGVCQATVSSIAASLGLHYKTVERKIDFLVLKKFIIDSNPKLRNRPHTYKINEVEFIKQFRNWKDKPASSEAIRKLKDDLFADMDED